jgi:hypothetical protein
MFELGLIGGALEVWSVSQPFELIEAGQSTTQLAVELLHVAVVRRNSERRGLHSLGLPIVCQP